MAESSTCYEPSGQSFLKAYNRRKVLGIFRERGPLSRIELAQIASLDKKTITNITRSLLDAGEICHVRTERQAAGRPKEVLALSDRFARCIGLDVGGSHVTGVIMDFTGRMLTSETVELDLRSPFDPTSFLSICCLIIDNMLLRCGLSMDEIHSIGVSIPGHVDSEGHATLVKSIPCLQDVNLREIFGRKYGKPVLVGDCSQLMALAEMRAGAGRDVDNFLVFDLGVGIGCGIVIGRSVYAGVGGKSGELGHSIVAPGGPKCRCGRSGCVEALASGWALNDFARKHAEENPGGILAAAMREDPHSTIRQIVAAAGRGSEYSRGLLERAGMYIGIAVSNAISLLNPPRIILGGRMVLDNPILLGSLEDTIREKTLESIYRDVQIVQSDLGGRASAIGAGLLCLEELFR